MEDDNNGWSRNPMNYLILVAPALLVLITITDAVTQLITKHSYTPQEWLLTLLSSTIAACLAKYFQQDYVKKLEKEHKVLKKVEEIAPPIAEVAHTVVANESIKQQETAKAQD